MKKQILEKKKNVEFDFIVIKDNSLKQKHKKRKYQIEENGDNDLTLDDLKKTLHKKIKIEKN